MVTTQEIAEKFGLKVTTVRQYLRHSSCDTHVRANSVRDYATSHGWQPRTKICVICGKHYVAHSSKQKCCFECKSVFTKSHHKESKYYKKVGGWRGGCFHTKDDETHYMEHLRENGYSNAEIAKKTGRSTVAVWGRIGRQPDEMTKQNRVLGLKVYAQKNAARKQYVINKPIIEYNKALNEVKVAAEHLEKLQQDLTVKEKIAQENARRTVDAPSIVLSTTQIAG